MARKKKPVNNSGIPQHIIESIARCILPDIIAYYETEEVMSRIMRKFIFTVW